jgi:hypothetical protein
MLTKIKFIKKLVKPGLFVVDGKYICAILPCNKKSLQNSLFGFPNCLTNNMAKGYTDKLTGTAFTLM